jgi:hypothetical protein
MVSRASTGLRETTRSDVVETATGRKPRAIIQTARTISCTASGVYMRTCAGASTSKTPYIGSR